MKTVKVDFKFEIGDIVEPYIAEYGRKYMILERIFQECIGGYQIHYQVRNMIDMAVNQGLKHVHEYEIKKSEGKDE